MRKDETNILIVDDEPANIKVLMSVLVQQGYEVRTALGGRLAVSSAIERVPDLILLDVRMPDMDGFEVCQRLKADRRVGAVPIIFISALGETEDIVTGLKRGGADYITKPFRIEEVLARVEAHLSILALQKQLEKNNARLRLEIEERKKAQGGLKKLNAELEQRVVDRTARLHAQTMELQAAKEAAETASTAKTKFLSNLSHELRTPLNPIMGYAQILMTQKNLTDEQTQQLRIICDNGAHLTALISDMLEFVRVDTCRETLDSIPFSLNDVVEGVVRDAKVKAAKKKIVVQYAEIGRIPRSVCGDGRKLYHILLHLLDNAVKFTDVGCVCLRLSVLRSPQSGASWRLRFEILDTGVGIDKDIMADIFLPFFQGELKGRLIDGTGLGLSLSQRLVALMGGRIWAQSPVTFECNGEGAGPGSGFTLELDFDAVVDDLPTATADMKKREQKMAAQGRILIVDDNPANLNFLVHALKPMGFELDEAANGQAALHLAEAYAPDMMLLDFLMPGLDGVHVLARIRSNPVTAGIKVIGVSGADSDARLADFVKACDDFIEKPVSLVRLREKVLKLLQPHG